MPGAAEENTEGHNWSSGSLTLDINQNHMNMKQRCQLVAISYWNLRPRLLLIFFLLWRFDPTRVMASSFLRFLDHTQRRSTVDRTPLDEWSAHRRDLYLTTHDTHNRQTSMPPVGFEHKISAGERLQTYALDRAATGTGRLLLITTFNSWNSIATTISETLNHRVEIRITFSQKSCLKQ